MLPMVKLTSAASATQRRARPNRCFRKILRMMRIVYKSRSRKLKFAE
jgi:hypothetical protein